jgi:hypothetical protein
MKNSTQSLWRLLNTFAGSVVSITGIGLFFTLAIAQNSVIGNTVVTFKPQWNRQNLELSLNISDTNGSPIENKKAAHIAAEVNRIYPSDTKVTEGVRWQHVQGTNQFSFDFSEIIRINGRALFLNCMSEWFVSLPVDEKFKLDHYWAQNPLTVPVEIERLSNAALAYLNHQVSNCATNAFEKLNHDSLVVDLPRYFDSVWASLTIPETSLYDPVFAKSFERVRSLVKDKETENSKMILYSWISKLQEIAFPTGDRPNLQTFFASKPEKWLSTRPAFLFDYFGQFLRLRERFSSPESGQFTEKDIAQMRPHFYLTDHILRHCRNKDGFFSMEICSPDKLQSTFQWAEFKTKDSVFSLLISQGEK